MTGLVNVDDETFGREVLKADIPCLVLFWAAWCGPCRIVAADLEEMASERTDVKFARVDADASPLAVAHHGVKLLPTMIVFNHGVAERKVDSSQPKDVIEAILEEHGFPAPPSSNSRGSLSDLLPRSACSMPVSPTRHPTPETLFEPPDPAGPQRFYLPLFRLVEVEADGRRTLRVRLRPAADGWRLEVACRAAARPGGTEPLNFSATPVLAYTTAGGLQRDIPLASSPEGQDVIAATLDLPTIVQRDEVFNAMTEFGWRCRLLLRCTFDAAVHVPREEPTPVGEPDPEELYRQVTHVLDVPLDFGDGLFVFNPALHPEVFRGVGDVNDDGFDVLTRTVRWNDRLHQYYQEDRARHVFRYLPDAFSLARTAQRPFVPNMRVHFESPDGDPNHIRVTIEYAVAPVVDEDRLRDAAAKLRVHLPADLPDGVTGPTLEPLVVTDPAKLLLVLSLPRGAGDRAGRREGVMRNLSDPFTDLISGLALADFRELLDAMLGSSGVVFTGTVHIGEQGGRAATSVPFRARLADLAGPVLAIEEAHDRGGALSVTMTNATESPVVIGDVPVQLTALDGGAVTTGRLEDLRTGDAPAAFPVELSAGQALAARVASATGPFDPAFVAAYDLRQVRARPEPEAVLNAIFDRTVPAEYTRAIRVIGVREWFAPHTNVSAIAIDFRDGDEVVLRAEQLEATANVRLPLMDLILHRQADTSYAYTQVTIRATGSIREDKADNLDILIPTPPP